MEHWKDLETFVWKLERNFTTKLSSTLENIESLHITLIQGTDEPSKMPNVLAILERRYGETYETIRRSNNRLRQPTIKIGL